MTTTPSSTTAKGFREDGAEFQNINLNDLNFKNEIRTEGEISAASREVDVIGVHLPIKDGLQCDGKDTLSDDEAAGEPLMNV